MNFSLYIAKRYLFSKSSNNTINIITFIATIGVIVGTTALFVVLSGFSGLRSFSLSYVSLIDPEIQITASKGKSFFVNPDFLSKISENNAILETSQVIEERAFFEYNKKTDIAYIKAIDKNYLQVNNMDTTLVVGTWVSDKLLNTAVIGSEIADNLGVGIFSFLKSLKIYVPKPQKGYASSLKNAFTEIHVQPSGIFQLNAETDGKYIFIPLKKGQELLNFKENQITALEIKLLPNADPSTVAEQLKERLGEQYTVKTRTELNAALHKMLNTENLMSYLIFTLVVIISLFNVIGAIIMMIIDKKNNIKTLHNLGCTVKQIKTIFILQGFLLTAFGLFIGLFIGISLVVLQLQFHIFKITASLAYPVELNISNILTVILTILILGYIAAKIASNRISVTLIR